MKNKYVMVGGLAFSEENDMKKLERYAREGWILECIVGGFFYKLKKDKPQDIVYSLDYQTDASEEYFTIFKEAGWELVFSLENQMHIFSAPVGTKPIYSDAESEIDKYTRVRNKTKRGAVYSLIVAIVLIGLLVTSIIFIRPIFLIVLALLVIDIFVFVFNFMPYLAYNSRIKKIKKYGECKSKTSNNKSLCMLYGFSGILCLVAGTINLFEKSYFEVFFMILGVCNIVSSFDYYKKYKKTL